MSTATVASCPKLAFGYLSGSSRNKALSGSARNKSCYNKQGYRPVPVKQGITAAEKEAAILAGADKRRERQARRDLNQTKPEQVHNSVRSLGSSQESDSSCCSSSSSQQRIPRNEWSPDTFVAYSAADASVVYKIDPYYQSKYEEYTVNVDDAKACQANWRIIASGVIPVYVKDNGQVSSVNKIKQDIGQDVVGNKQLKLACIARCHCKDHHKVFRPFWIYNEQENRICSMGETCLRKMGFREETERFKRALRTCMGCSRDFPATSLPGRTCEQCHYKTRKDYNAALQNPKEYRACPCCFRYIRKSNNTMKQHADGIVVCKACGSTRNKLNKVIVI